MAQLKLQIFEFSLPWLPQANASFEAHVMVSCSLLFEFSSASSLDGGKLPGSSQATRLSQTEGFLLCVSGEDPSIPSQVIGGRRQPTTDPKKVPSWMGSRYLPILFFRFALFEHFIAQLARHLQTSTQRDKTIKHAYYTAVPSSIGCHAIAVVLTRNITNRGAIKQTLIQDETLHYVGTCILLHYLEL